MSEFKGSFEDLQAELATAGCVGAWTEIANGKQLKSTDGGILNWFPATGKINFQGGAGAKAKLQDLLAVFGAAVAPAMPAAPKAVAATSTR